MPRTRHYQVSKPQIECPHIKTDVKPRIQPMANDIAFMFSKLCEFQHGLLEISLLSLVNIPKLHSTLAKQQQ